MGKLTHQKPGPLVATGEDRGNGLPWNLCDSNLRPLADYARQSTRRSNDRSDMSAESHSKSPLRQMRDASPTFLEITGAWDTMARKGYDSVGGCQLQG